MTLATDLHRLQIKDIAALSTWRGIVFLAFALLIFWQASMTLRRAAGDRPYGAGIGWDEIATYNSARVVSGRYMASTFRYGTLDTFLQILATQYFLLFDPDGPGEDHYAFTNNNLTSFTSRHVEFDGSLAGTTFGYSYFRGLDDHQPILLARKIHSLATYGLAMLIGGLVAIALNMKIDASLLVGVLGLAIVILGWRSGLESFGRQILLSAGSFALVYAVTNPEVLINPCFVLSRQMPPTGDPLGLARTVRQNLPVLGLFLETNLVPWKISNLPLGMLSIGLVTLVLGTITIVHRRGGANPLALTIPTAAVLMLWLYPMLTISSFNARYYLNGLGALYALVGATLVTSWRSRASVARACVVAVLALLLVQYGALMSTHRAAAAQATAQTFYVAVGDRHNGFARGFTRNEIERRAIEASARRRLRPHHPGRSARLFRPADAAVGKHEAGVCQYVQLRRSVARPRSVGRSFAAALAGELCDGSQLVEPVGDLMDARGGAAV